MIRPDCYNTSDFDVDAAARGLGLKRIGKDRYQGNCPACGYKNAFSLSVADNGKPLMRCHVKQCEVRPFLKSIYNHDYNFSSAFHSAPLRRYAKAKIPKTHLEDETIKYSESDRCSGDDPVTKYLRSRGITIDVPPTIGYQELWNNELQEKYPAMVGFVLRVGQRDIIAKHVTYLKKDGSGKIDSEAPKKIFGSFHAGAVMLAPPAYKLAISEGIETGLSFQQGSGIPTWAALSSGNIPNLILPPKPMASEVIIAADYDKAGLDAALSAQERWTAEGRDVRVVSPDEIGADFNDALVKELARIADAEGDE